MRVTVAAEVDDDDRLIAVERYRIAVNPITDRVAVEAVADARESYQGHYQSRSAIRSVEIRCRFLVISSIMAGQPAAARLATR